MRTRPLLTAVSMALTVSIESGAQPTARKVYAGVISNVVGTCTLQPAAGATKVVLHSKNTPKKVYVEDTLSCGKDSYLILELVGDDGDAGGDGEARKKPRRGKTSVEPLETLVVPRITLPRQDGFGPTVTGFDMAGEWRMGGRAVSAPADGESIRPGDFTIRWTEAGPVTASLTLTDDRGRVLWAADGVSPHAGALSLAEARANLSRYRDDDRTGPVTLYVTDTAGHRTEVNFYLLSAGDEQKLARDLQFCEDKAKDIMLVLCRVAAFERFRMFNEVTTAYDAALLLAPESEDLIANAMTAQQRVGNVKRFNELHSKVQPRQ